MSHIIKTVKIPCSIKQNDGWATRNRHALYTLVLPIQARCCEMCMIIQQNITRIRLLNHAVTDCFL